jgi:hypothetical protein
MRKSNLLESDCLEDRVQVTGYYYDEDEKTGTGNAEWNALAHNWVFNTAILYLGALTP